MDWRINFRIKSQSLNDIEKEISEKINHLVDNHLDSIGLEKLNVALKSCFLLAQPMETVSFNQGHLPLLSQGRSISIHSFVKIRGSIISVTVKVEPRIDEINESDPFVGLAIFRQKIFFCSYKTKDQVDMPETIKRKSESYFT